MGRFFLVVGASLAMLGVAGGAFGAHFLKSIFSEKALQVFEVGIRYQMYHSLALCLVGLRFQQTPSPWLGKVGFMFIVGIVLFSGSLYLMSFSGIKWLGAITPLGGLAFLLGWGYMAWGEYRQFKEPSS